MQHKVGYKRYKTLEDRYKYFIDEGTLSDETKELLWDWVEERKANGKKEVPTIGTLGTLVNISQLLDKCLLEVTNKDIKAMFNNTKFKITTELWYKKVLIAFYKWVAKNKDNPKYLHVINWIDNKGLSKKCSEHAKKRREDDLLSPENVRKMISKCITLRDKLAVSLLADTGIRAESVGASHNNRSINIGQIKFHKGYAIIKDIEEKFDKRRDVIVTEALSYLIKYYNEYPEDLKADPLSPLFLTYSNNRFGQRWGYSGLKDLINKISIKAIGRMVNPHDFRHLKGTRLHLDEKLSDDAKCKLMGWSSRRMLDRYNHTKFEDAMNELLEKKGIIKKDKTQKSKIQPSILQPKECLVCRNINSFTDSICENCGNSLDYEGMIKDFTKKEQAEKELRNFMDPKEIQGLFKTVYKLQKQIEGLGK